MITFFKDLQDRQELISKLSGFVVEMLFSLEKKYFDVIFTAFFKKTSQLTCKSN